MKSLSFKRVISFCLALVAMISCVSVLAFADCKASDARIGTKVWVKTSESYPFFWSKPTVKIKNDTNKDVYVSCTITENYLKQAVVTLPWGSIGKKVSAHSEIEVKLTRGCDMVFASNRDDVKITVTPGKFIWNIWGGTAVNKK